LPISELPIVWFTGLSGAGKSTLCRAVESRLRNLRIPVTILDGDLIRKDLSKDLGYSREDRTENLRRINQVAETMNQTGTLVLIAAISPYRDIREEIRTSHSRFLEVFVNAPLDVCEQRDPKGLYVKARSGVISDFTGISSPYEPPIDPDVECHTDKETVEVSCDKVMAALRRFLNSFFEHESENESVLAAGARGTD
jgi:adenylylsulfate kinase